jgi:alkanesulfonate monooxygenase SsuD/methylene tetrahydromethanopterin reductase-like flavin-dependent oxidoreductase (luciferase family)
MSMKAACLRRWSFSPTSRRRPTYSSRHRHYHPADGKPLRVAEDAAVLDLLTDGRLEVGFGSGGTPTSFLPFGLTSEQRGAVFADHLHLIHSAWRGDSLSHPDNHLYPPAPQLADLDRHLLG